MSMVPKSTDGPAECRQEGVGRINGDPHYHTFDMKMIHFQAVIDLEMVLHEDESMRTVLCIRNRSAEIFVAAPQICVDSSPLSLDSK